MRNQNYLSIGIEKNENTVALARRLGNKKDRADSLAASQAIANVTQEIVLNVIQQAPTFPNFFQIDTYGSDEAPVLHLAEMYDVRQPGYFNVFSFQINGGLSSNHLQGAADVVVNTHKYQGAADMDKKWLRVQNPRLQSISSALTRLAQEVLLKQNRDATNVVMASLANSFIDGNSANTATTNYQIVRSATAGVFQLDDFNTMMTKYRRIVSSWVGGTPIGIRASLSDMIGSPEWMAQIRSIAYQPQNTRNGATTTSGASSIAAPESIREEIFRSAGMTSIFDVDLHEFNEMGVGQSYNTVFANYATGTYIGNGGTGSATFNSATEQVVIGLNSGFYDLVRLRMLDENADQWTLTADDQYSLREDKVGWVGELQEGYFSADGRGKMGLIW